MGHRFVLLSYATEAPFRYILAGRGKTVLHYDSVQHAYSAGRGRPPEELLPAVMRNTKHLLLSLPTSLF